MLPGVQIPINASPDDMPSFEVSAHVTCSHLLLDGLQDASWKVMARQEGAAPTLQPCVILTWVSIPSDL